MALTVTGKSTHVGQIVKVLDSESGDTAINEAAGAPAFEFFHKKELTVAVFNKGSAQIQDVKLMRILHDGTQTQESISAGPFTTGNGVTFAVSYNVPKFRIEYTKASGSTGQVYIEVEGGY